MGAGKTDYGSGPLFKAAGLVYGIMLGDALLVLANLLVLLMPLLVGLVGPVALLGSVLVGPSAVAASYAFNRLLAGQDTGVFRDFLASYRSNFGQAVVVWLPYLVLLGIIAFNLTVLPGSLSAGTGNDTTQIAARIGLLALGIMVFTAAANAMLLVSRFTFRTQDVYRLSVFTLGARTRVSLGNAGILFVTAFILMVTTVWLALFVAGPVLYLICLNSKPLLIFVEEKFTAPR